MKSGNRAVFLLIQPDEMFPFPLAPFLLAYVCAVSFLLAIVSAINAEMPHCRANLNTVSQEGKLFLRFYVGAKRNRTRNRVEKSCLLLDASVDWLIG